MNSKDVINQLAQEGWINVGGKNDVLNGAQGDDQVDGGDGTDIVEFSGSFADYRIVQLDSTTWRVADTLSHKKS